MPTTAVETKSSADEISISSTSYTRVRDAIRERIVGGVYLPGARLKVHDLCKQFGISSNPIREALQHLQGEGIVVISPNKGATVRLIDEQLLRHIYEIGEGLDGILANRCAAVATPPQVEYLRHVQAQMEEAARIGDSEARVNFNGEFHTQLGIISGNTEAIDIRQRHQNLIRTIRQRYGYSPARIDEIHAEHHAIIDAIALGDVSGAERAARYHAARSCDDMLRRYRAVAD